MRRFITDFSRLIVVEGEREADSMTANLEIDFSRLGLNISAVRPTQLRCRELSCCPVRGTLPQPRGKTLQFWASKMGFSHTPKN